MALLDGRRPRDVGDRAGDTGSVGGERRSERWPSAGVTTVEWFAVYDRPRDVRVVVIVLRVRGLARGQAAAMVRQSRFLTATATWKVRAFDHYTTRISRDGMDITHAKRQEKMTEDVICGL